MFFKCRGQLKIHNFFQWVPHSLITEIEINHESLYKKRCNTYSDIVLDKID